MSEIINNSQKRKELLKHMILQLHSGDAPELVRARLVELLKSIPYDEVVEVEQELIWEGLPEEEVLRFCDIHTAVLDGHIDQSGARSIPAGHPVDTFKMENRELEKVADELQQLFGIVPYLKDKEVKDSILWILNQVSIADKSLDNKSATEGVNTLINFIEAQEEKKISKTAASSLIKSARETIIKLSP